MPQSKTKPAAPKPAAPKGAKKSPAMREAPVQQAIDEAMAERAHLLAADTQLSREEWMAAPNQVAELRKQHRSVDIMMSDLEKRLDEANGILHRLANLAEETREAFVAQDFRNAWAGLEVVIQTAGLEGSDTPPLDHVRRPRQVAVPGAGRRERGPVRTRDDPGEA